MKLAPEKFLLSKLITGFWILRCQLGILGLLARIALWGYYLYLAFKSSVRGVEAVAIAYLIFTFTWFDCAQYAHIAWYYSLFRHS